MTLKSIVYQWRDLLYHGSTSQITFNRGGPSYVQQSTEKASLSVAWNSTSGGWAYIWQSKWVGIIAVKTKRTQIHFLSDFLVAVASLDLKVPNEKNKTIVIFVFILIYSERVVNFPCECHGASLKSLNKLSNTSVFIAAEKWMVQYKYWSWWPYFSSKREPATLKTLESFS